MQPDEPTDPDQQPDLEEAIEQLEGLIEQGEEEPNLDLPLLTEMVSGEEIIPQAGEESPPQEPPEAPAEDWDLQALMAEVDVILEEELGRALATLRESIRARLHDLLAEPGEEDYTELPDELEAEDQPSLPFDLDLDGGEPMPPFPEEE